MRQIFVAAWVGISAGWIGFGWVLAEAPVDVHNRTHVQLSAAMEPNMRG